ncbi:q1 protein [Pantoea agglomerans]|nr:q1 protein [Pantoea agglomerans]
MMSQQEFSKFALDYLVFGNAFAELRRNGLETTPAKFTRRGLKKGIYWFVNDWKKPHEFSAGSVFQLLEPDINQKLYGLPE